MSTPSTTALQTELPITDGGRGFAGAVGSPPLRRDRQAYIEECSLRWHGECLRDARRNWAIFEKHHEAVVAVLTPYLRDNWVEDIHGKIQNPDGTLTAWLWKCSDQKDNWWIWDFCEHYQTCHLRRGLIAYAKQVISELANTAVSQPGGQSHE